MKSFLEKILEQKDDTREEASSKQHAPSAYNQTRNPAPPVRVAVYDSLAAPPRVVELCAEEYDEFINLLATKTYRFSQEKRGSVPFTVIKEVIENLIHASFSNVTITVLDNGNTIRVSDQGPGIKNKKKALEPGFSTATQEMKQTIKGVGSGLPIVKEALSCAGGAITIEDNLEEGTVVTLSVPPQTKEEATTKEATPSLEFTLSKRQRKVLFLVTELGSVGPSRVANELSISLSSAYRDLLHLESLDLIKSNERGKRSLTAQGIEYLDVALNT